MQPLRITDPQDAYKKQRILTASPAELIVLLFDGLKKCLLMGQRYIGKGDASSAHSKLMRAQEIIVELINSLDMNYEMSGDLLSVYEFMLVEIEEANKAKDVDRIVPLLDIVEEFRGVWEEVSRSQKGGGIELSAE